MIIDCVLFCDEAEVLNLRISYLKPIVDLFVVFESDYNFAGKAKELLGHKSLSNENRDANCLFVKYECPVHLIELAQMGNRWPIEKYARESISQFIRNSVGTDTILVSDVDEIPSRFQVLAGQDIEIAKLRTPLYYRRANWSVQHGSDWSTVLIGKPKYLDNLNELRYKKCITISQNPGCHLSYLSAGKNPQAIFRKLSTSAHSEFSQDQTSIENRTNFADKYVIDHLGRFDRTGFGLIDVKKPHELNEIQLLLMDKSPELFDFTKVPFRKSERIYASYVLTNNWNKGQLLAVENHPGLLELKLVRILSQRVLRIMHSEIIKAFRKIGAKIKFDQKK